jgi:hypothetical protein
MSDSNVLISGDLPDKQRQQQLQQKIYEYKQAENALQDVKGIVENDSSTRGGVMSREST